MSSLRCAILAPVIAHRDRRIARMRVAGEHDVVSDVHYPTGIVNDTLNRIWSFAAGAVQLSLCTVVEYSA